MVVVFLGILLVDTNVKCPWSSIIICCGGCKNFLCVCVCVCACPVCDFVPEFLFKISSYTFLQHNPFFSVCPVTICMT